MVNSKKEEGSMAYTFLVSHKWIIQADSKREIDRERERENVMFQFVFRHSHMVWCTEVVFQCLDTAFGVSGIVGVDRIRWRQA